MSQFVGHVEKKHQRLRKIILSPKKSIYQQIKINTKPGVFSSRWEGREKNKKILNRGYSFNTFSGLDVRLCKRAYKVSYQP